MTSTTPASASRTVDVIHFIKGFPPQLGIFDANVFSASIDQSQFEGLAAETASMMGGEFFSTARSITCLGIRTESDSIRDAVGFTRYYADALIDGLSLGLSRPLPTVSTLCVVHDSAEPTPRWLGFSPELWIRFGTEKSDPNAPPSLHAQQLLAAAAPVLDIVSKSFPQHDTEVARQLAQSFKMFRHGVSATSFAVEYICKFSALEGLICAKQDGKAALLRNRLPQLFRKDPLVNANKIQKLWNDRNAAIHESAGFYSAHAAGSRPVQAYMNEIDYLFRGTVAFVIDGLRKHSNLPDLWATVHSFELPPWALVRPTSQLLPHAMVMDSGVAAPWARKLFDEQLESAHKRREEKPA